MTGGFMLSASSSSQVPLARGVPYSGGGGDRRLRAVVGVQAPYSVFLQVSDRHGGRRDAEKLGGERLDVSRRYPRRTQAGIDVAGQHVLRLDGTQRLGIAGIVRSGLLGSLELRADVAR